MAGRQRFGSVRKLKSGRWQARYSTATGDRIKAPKTFATKADAQRWLSAIETDLQRGDFHDPRLAEILFGEWTERWLATKTPQLAPASVDLYAYLLRCHISPTFDKQAIGQITAMTVQTWLARLHETDLSPNTVAKAYRLLAGVLDGAVEAGIIQRSPCTLKGAGTERHAEMRVATPEQVAELADAVGPRWEALVLTAAYSGLRWGELAALRRCDVDLAQGTISVVRKLSEVNGKLTFGPPKTAAGRRVVGVPDFVADSIQAHLLSHAESGDDALVFAAPGGGPMRRSNFRRRVWEPATAETGMSGLRVHDLRHTAATLAASSGTSLKALMARIGHASAAAALRYQHVVDGQDEEIVRHLQLVGEAPGVPASDREEPSPLGTQWARNDVVDELAERRTPSDQDFCGGADGTRTHDPLLAKQVL